MKLFAKLKNDKKGFTLVEMIVVIVIIGILLAILVPGMFKYIDKAKDKQIQVNARTACLNIEEAVAEVYGKNGVTGNMIMQWFTGTETKQPVGGVNFPIDNSKLQTAIVFTNTTEGVKTEVKYKLMLLPNDTAKITLLTVDDKGEVIEMTYQEGEKEVVLDATGWSDVTKVTH